MGRRGLSRVEQHARAVRAARRMISAGERPGYRLLVAVDGWWGVVGLPVVTGTAASVRDAADAARATIAEVLGVPPDSFDVDA